MKMNNTKKLLVTDNLKLITEAGKPVLMRKGIKIFTSSTPEDILNVHRHEIVDLIITDIDMPETRKAEVCSALKGIRLDDVLKNVSIITICGKDKSSIASSCACGANAFIKKPLDSATLFRRINEFLNITERRSHRVILNVVIKGQSGDKYFFANSGDISNSGILFETEEFLEEGDRIKCSFFVGRDMITTNGKVVRVKRKSPDLKTYGVQFIDLDPVSKGKIDEFINEAI
jgi:DNA-binding NarL/FixJ family response regulator